MRALFFLALLAVFWASLAPPIDYDLWFDIRMGEEIVRTHSIPHVDTSFLDTAPLVGSHYTPNDEWGFCLAVYLVYQAGGMVGLALAKSALLTLLFGVLWSSCRKLELPPWACAGWISFGYYLMQSRFMLRPQLATDVCLAVLVAALLRPDRVKPWMAFGFFVVWANLHAGFVIGLVVLSVWLVLQGAGARKTLQWLVLGALAPLVTPGNWRLYRYIYDHFVTRQSDMSVIAEWDPAGPGWYYGPLGLFALLACGSFGYSLYRRQLRLPYPAVTGLLFLLTLQHNRAVGELVAGALPLLAVRLPSRRWLEALAGVGLLAWILLRGMPGQLEPVGIYPDGALRELEKRGYQGVILNTYHFGGWLVFKHQRPFIHGMTSKYPLPLMDEYLTVLKDPARSPGMLQHYHVGAILLHYPAYNDIHTAFMERLKVDPHWSLVYWDDLCLLFLPSPQEGAYTAVQPALPDPFVDRGGGAPGGSPNWEEADRELARKLAEDPNCVVAWRLLAQLRLRQDRPQEAEQSYREMTRRFPQDPAGFLGLGALYFNQSKLELAVTNLQEAVRLGPQSGTARYDLLLALTAQLRAGQGNLGQAQRAAAEALPWEKEFPAVRGLYDQLKGAK